MNIEVGQVRRIGKLRLRFDLGLLDFSQPTTCIIRRSQRKKLSRNIFSTDLHKFLVFSGSSCWPFVTEELRSILPPTEFLGISNNKTFATVAVLLPTTFNRLDARCGRTLTTSHQLSRSFEFLARMTHNKLRTLPECS